MQNGYRTIALAALSLPLFLQLAQAQNLVAANGLGQVMLAPNSAMVTFVPSGANTAKAAAMDVALSTAKSQAATAAILRAIPIPVVGPFVPYIGAALNKFKSAKPTIGFSIAFVNGVSAATAIAPDSNFTVSAQSLQGGAPFLLRIKPLPKDSTRIVRSLHVSVKLKGNTLTADGQKPQILDIEQEVVSCHQETRNGDVVLSPDSPLDPGEYAVAVVPASEEAMTPVGLVWDFRVDSNGAPRTTAASPAPSQSPAPAKEPKTIGLGQTTSEVVSAFGTPDKVVKLGAKEIYYYKDLRVIFLNSKVSDVQ